MTLQKRAQKLYAVEEERWRGAWDDFYERVWVHLETPMLEAYTESRELPEATQRRIEQVTGEVLDLSEEAGSAWTMWAAEFSHVEPPDLSDVDLTYWPHSIPAPPEEPRDMWDQASAAFYGTDCDCHIAASWILVILSLARARRGLTLETA